MRTDLTSAFSNIFVGRKRELQQLHAYLDEAKKGCGRFVVISGEAGIGKSTLVRHFSEKAAEAGATCISIRFHQDHEYQPYAPFLRIVEQFSAATISTSPVLATAGKTDALSDVQRSADRDEWDLKALYSFQTKQGLAQQWLLSRILEVALLVINLGDVHLAPLTAWKFIHYLCESIGEHKILLLATLRRDGRSHSKMEIPVYSEVLQRMNREGLLESFRLKRLGEKNIRGLLRRVFQRRDFSANFMPLLQEVTDGIPDQLVSCLEEMLAEGIVFHEKGIWFNQENITRDSLFNLTKDGEDVQQALRRVEELSMRQRKLLQYISLMDRAVDHLILSTILKRPGVGVIKDILFLKERKLLNQVGEDSYVFKLSVIREVIRDKISAKKRLSMHHMIAAAVESAGHLERLHKIYLLAFHYSQTDDKEATFRYLVQAGDLALGNFAFLEAKDFFDRAMNLVLCLPKQAQKEEIQLLIRSAWLERLLGNWQRSIECCQSAMGLGGKGLESKIRNQILVQQGLTYFHLYDWQRARESFDKCLENVKSSGPFDQALIHYGLGNVYFELSDYETSEQHYEKALKLARKADAKQLLANITNNMGSIEIARGKGMAAIAKYSKSISIFQSLGDNLGLAQIYHNIGMTHAEEGNWELANEFYGKSLAVSDVLGIVPLKSTTFLNRALALAHLKNFVDAREYNFKAYRTLRRLDDELGLAEYHKVQGVIERGECNWAESLRHLTLATEKFKKVQNRLGRAETEYELALLALAMENQDDVTRWLNHALASYREIGLQGKVNKIQRHIELFSYDVQAASNENYN
jgi:tetratricopeptide (TPR) repeat protein